MLKVLQDQKKAHSIQRVLVTGTLCPEKRSLKKDDNKGYSSMFPCCCCCCKLRRTVDPVWHHDRKLLHLKAHGLVYMCCSFSPMTHYLRCTLRMAFALMLHCMFVFAWCFPTCRSLLTEWWCVTKPYLLKFWHTASCTCMCTQERHRLVYREYII